MAQRTPGTWKSTTAPLRIIIAALVIVISLQGGVAGSLPGSDVQTGGTLVKPSVSGAQAKNVILLIGDGMGRAHIEAARWRKAGSDPDAYTSVSLAMDQLEYSGTVSTPAADTSVTDSAAAATALMTGVKTNVGVIGQDATAVTGVSDGIRLTTIAEMAKARGRMTGVVTNGHLTDAPR
jgi:alkaline phosphatase